LGKRRNEEVVDSYQYYGEKNDDEDDEEEDEVKVVFGNGNKPDGVISGEEIIETSG